MEGGDVLIEEVGCNGDVPLLIGEEVVIVGNKREIVEWKEREVN